MRRRPNGCWSTRQVQRRAVAVCCVAGRSTILRRTSVLPSATTSDRTPVTGFMVFVWPELTTYLLNNFTPSDSTENLRLLCTKCHNKKHNFNLATDDGRKKFNLSPKAREGLLTKTNLRTSPHFSHAFCYAAAKSAPGGLTTARDDMCEKWGLESATRRGDRVRGLI